LRVTPDANVLVRAHPRSRSTGRKLIVALIEGGHTLLLSNEIITETIQVLRYPRQRKRFALTDEELCFEAAGAVHALPGAVHQRPCGPATARRRTRLGWEPRVTIQEGMALTFLARETR
jgi:predicted nucleic acid-binding protein